MATASEALKRLRFAGGFELLVDGFQFQRPEVRHYVLSHFHADHTVGLNKGFSSGMIYCTEATSRLVKEHIGVGDEFICSSPLDKTFNIVDGIRVTFLDAGHCPGSAIIVFEECMTSRIIVHTGDLRASQDVRDGISSWLNGRCVEELYLDTTYCSPRWDFPDQNVACEWMRELTRRELAREPDTLFLVGSYQIGKEKAAKAVAEAACSSVFVDHRRWTSIKAVKWDGELLAEDKPLWSIDKADCKVWMLPLGGLSHEVLLHHLESTKGGFKSVVAFRPTGWSFTNAQRKKGLDAIKPWVENQEQTRLYAVPYSEHSSFQELQDLVKSLRPKRVIPTVNAESRASKEKVMKPLLGLLDLTSDRERMDFYLASKQGDQLGKEHDKVDVLAISRSAPSRRPHSAGKMDVLSSSATSDSSSPEPSGMHQFEASIWQPAEVSGARFSRLQSGPVRVIDLDLESVDGDAAAPEGNKSSSSASAHAGASEAPADVSELRQVDLAQQSRMLRYYESLKMQKDAATGSKQAMKKPRLSKKEWKRRKEQRDAKHGSRQSALAGMLGVKVTEPSEKKKVKGKQKRKNPECTGGGDTKRPQKKRENVTSDASPKENRPTRFIPRPTARIRERIERAFAHRLYLLSHEDVQTASSSSSTLEHCNESGVVLDVLGSTGNVYRVSLMAGGNNCACPDFSKGGGACKHLLFVMLRVLKLNRDDPRVWQTSLTASELNPILAHLREIRGKSHDVMADESVLRGYAEATGDSQASKTEIHQPLPEDCPICFEEITEENVCAHADACMAAVACRCCGHHLHVDCRRRWANSSAKGNTCPLCRNPWETCSNNAGSEQTLNLASFSNEHRPSLQELYPDTHRWISRNAQASIAGS